MQDIALRITTAAAVSIILFLYLYEVGARRLLDTVIALTAFVVTLPVFAALASASSLVNLKIFDRTEKGLVFTYPKGKIKNLARLLSVMSGRCHILPPTLFRKRKRVEATPEK